VVALTAAASSSAWNAGGSILTFYFPIGLFVVIAGLLCLQFGRPHAIPGRRPLALARSSTHSAGPAEPGPEQNAADTGAPEADG
jgi:hypothetical protein